MPPRSKVTRLPPNPRQWVEETMIANGFSDYEQISRVLKERFDQNVSKSALHRHGVTLEKKLQKELDDLRVATEQARVIVNESPDPEGAVNDAIIRTTQLKLMQVARELDIDPAKVSLTSVTRAIADLARASISQKRFAAETRAKLGQKFNELEKEVSEGKRKGMTLEGLRAIREQAYQIV